MFLETIPKPVVSLPPRPAPPRRPSFAASYPRQAMPPPAMPLVPGYQAGPQQSSSVPRPVLASPKLLPPGPKVAGPKQQDMARPSPLAKPYVYKPRKSMDSSPSSQFTPQKFTAKAPPPISPVSQQLVANQQRAASHHQQQHQHSAGKGLSSGTDRRFKGSATSRSSAPDRFSSFGGINGFPQLPGLTWPPAHMNSRQYSHPQTRVWPSSTSPAGPRPERVPMTSSELKQTSPTVAKVGAVPPQTVHAYQKYSFFQVHHNW